MPNLKISQLPAATTPLTGAELVPIVQSSATDQVTVANLTDGRAVSALSYNKITLTAPATGATFTLADSKTFAVNHSLTLAGTDSTTMTFPTTSATVARTDATQTFAALQNFSTNTATSLPASGISGSTVAHFYGADGGSARTMIQSFGGQAALDLRRAQGTATAPTTVANTNVLGSVAVSGYNGTAYTTVRGSIGFVATETWSSTANGTYLSFQITPRGTATATEVAAIEDNGRIDIGRVALAGAAPTVGNPARMFVRGNTYTDNTTAASGTVASVTVNELQSQALAATNATVTYTNASTLYIAGGPSAGANVTITNPWALRVDVGNSYLGDRVDGNPANVDSVGFRGTPVNSQSAAYQLVAADAGKTILHPITDNNARTFTIPANGTVAFPVGTTITFINMINTVTIAITTDTMYLAGAGTTGSRTLAAYGMATAVKVASTTWVISGNGLT